MQKDASRRSAGERARAVASDGGRGSVCRSGEPRPEQRQVLTKDQMQMVQARLTAAGVDPGPANGVTNPRTEAAIRH
jgi:peptidoglycan hydrolase-like protein with peptidoglycan-binding domain